jgi:hypothetical protein
MLLMPASIDSNRVVDCKALLCVLWWMLVYPDKSGQSFLLCMNHLNRLTVDSVIWSSRTSN